MKAVKLLGNCELEVRDVEKPQLRKGWVIVKMHASAICGSDLHALYEQSEPIEITPGHEFAGEVVESMSESPYKQGDRVAVNAFIGCGKCDYCRQGVLSLCSEVTSLGFELDGGDQEFVLVPIECCLPLTDDITYDLATLVGDVIGLAWHQLNRIHARAHDVVAVSGLGPMGLGAVIVATYLGCRVIGIDKRSYRLDLARQLGAEQTINADSADLQQAVMDFSKGKGFDIGIECSGQASSLNFLLDNAAKCGRVCLVGENNKASIQPSAHFLGHHLTMIGSSYFNVGDYESILEVIRKAENIDKIITHRFALPEADKAFATFLEGNTGKAIFINN